MNRSALIKVCGLTNAEQARYAVSLGADFLGFIFFAGSPRHLTLSAWSELACQMPAATVKVGVFVNPSDREIEAVMNAGALDWIQLHGHETPDRLRAVKRYFGANLIKAIAVHGREDVARAADYRADADKILFDAKPPSDFGMPPGGNGLKFDWRHLQCADLGDNWALAGGLDPDNIRLALRLTDAPMVDVSTGVERAPGDKDAVKMQRFIERCKR